MPSERSPLLQPASNPSPPPERLPEVEEEPEDEESVHSFDFSNGSFRQLIIRYLIVVPATCALTVALIILALPVAFPIPENPPYKVTSLSVVPFFAAVVSWIASHAVKTSLWSWLAPMGGAGDVLSTSLHVFISECLRLSTVILLMPPPRVPESRVAAWQAAFFYVAYFTALGWAVAEVVVGIVQGYQQLRLYRDLFTDEDSDSFLEGGFEVESPVVMGQEASGNARTVTFSLPAFIEDQVEAIIRVRYLSEIEDIYGVPLTEIPIFVTTLQRIDSILLSLGLTILLSSSLLDLENLSSIRIVTTFFATAITHILVSLLWTPRILPRIGVHVAAYVSFMASIGAIWVGLWQWDLVF